MDAKHVQKDINLGGKNCFELLPVELTRTIFVLCLPELFIAVRQPTVSAAPILLCHVCGQWRRIALDTPELWAKLHTRITTFTFLRKVAGVLCDNGAYLSPKSHDFINWWFNNINSRPFTLSLDQCVAHSGYNLSDRYQGKLTIYIETRITTQSYKTFLSSPFVTSAQNLYLQSEQVLKLCRIPSIEFSNLRAISVDMEANHVDGDHFPSAPHLRRLHIRSPKTLPTFPFTQLTHLGISSAPELVTLRHILGHHCPNLVFAGFQLQQWRLPRQINAERTALASSRVPIRVCKLRQLMLSGYTSANAFEFLKNFSFPSLSTLCLQLTRTPPNTQHNTDDLFLDSFRAAPHLTEVHLTGRLFCPENGAGGFDHTSQRARGGLSALLPDLRHTTLYINTAVTRKNKAYFKELICSGFLRPASTTHSTTIDVVFGECIPGTSTTLKPHVVDLIVDRYQNAEEDLMAELLVKANTNGYDDQSGLNHQLNIRRFPHGHAYACKLSSSEYFRDPSRWEETGFHEVAHAPK